MVLIRTSTETWSAEYTVQGNRDAQIVRIKSRSSITVVIAKIMENLPLVGTTVTYYISVPNYGIALPEIESLNESAWIVDRLLVRNKRAAQLLEVYGELHDYNSDFVGWIRVPGTEINYPVMQSPNSPNYYLRRNFEKAYSNLGTPYLQENCDIHTCDNLIIYGHHMLDGGMFSDLELYKQEAFWENHKYVRFDTLDELGLYEIMAVVITTAYQADSFQYYNYIENNELTFNTYVQECKQRALYDTGIDAEYGDKLVTLSTCEYSNDNGRLIVVAKKIGGIKK